LTGRWSLPALPAVAPVACTAPHRTAQRPLQQLARALQTAAAFEGKPLCGRKDQERVSRPGLLTLLSRTVSVVYVLTASPVRSHLKLSPARIRAVRAV
jgi:hypothetical protein